MNEQSVLPPGVPDLVAGRYELQSLIGRGGMADVYLGMDRVLSRKVAIKLLRPDMARDSMVVARFEREAKAVAGSATRTSWASTTPGSSPPGTPGPMSCPTS